MRVLIIDDSPDATYLMSVLVQHYGHETVVVNLPEEALEVATDWKPEFVFMDLAMPGIDGYSVARQLRESAGLNGARIFALSGYQQNSEKQAVAGIDGHVLKPIDIKQIESLLGDNRQPGIVPQTRNCRVASSAVRSDDSS